MTLSCADLPQARHFPPTSAELQEAISLKSFKARGLITTLSHAKRLGHRQRKAVRRLLQPILSAREFRRTYGSG
jgi:hypothetical protein